MATWHQKQARIPLYHETQWTIVNDPPNECLGLSRFESKELAEQVLSNWKKNVPENCTHMYILAPYKK